MIQSHRATRDDQQSPQQRIVTATIECIERHGVQGTTIRRIAEIAGVNSAAISYYFRGKDNLVDLALAQALENAFDWGDFRGSESLPAAGRVVAIFDDLVTGALRYPGTTKALFYGTVVGGRYDTLAMRKLNAFLEELAVDLASRGVALGDAELRTALAQMAAASLLLAATMPETFDRFAGFSLADPEARLAYLRRLAERLFRP